MPVQQKKLGTPDQHKLTGIECVRFLCALSVLVWHYQHFSYVGANAVDFVRTAQPFYGLLAPFYKFGELGVEFFWCISGFIFFWKYRESIRSKRVGPYQFFILRLSRLYPLHIVTLLFVAAMQAVYFAATARFFVYQHDDLHHFVLQILMASNWGFEEGYSFNGPIWSISLEVLVYVSFYFLSRFLGSNLVSVLSVAGLSLLAVVSKHDQSGLFLCALYFYAGGVAAIVYGDLPKLGSKLALTADGAAVIAVIGVMSASFLLPAHRSPSPLAVTLISAPALIFLVSRHVHLTGRLAMWAQIAGNMTYSSYLIHFPIQLSIATFCAHKKLTMPIYNGWLLVSFVIGTLLLSVLCFKYFEMPIQRLLRRLMLPPVAVSGMSTAP